MDHPCSHECPTSHHAFSVCDLSPHVTKHMGSLVVVLMKDMTICCLVETDALEAIANHDWQRMVVVFNDTVSIHLTLCNDNVFMEDRPGLFMQVNLIQYLISVLTWF